jgi:hypothetical protein
MLLQLRFKMRNRIIVSCYEKMLKIVGTTIAKMSTTQSTTAIIRCDFLLRNIHTPLFQ